MIRSTSVHEGNYWTIKFLVEEPWFSVIIVIICEKVNSFSKSLICDGV